MIPPTMYYGKVGLELAKLVAQGQKMSPPYVSTYASASASAYTHGSNMQTFQTYGQNLMSAVRNPSANAPSNPLQAMRNIGSTQVMTAGVVAAEVLGFFTVGEMIGRMKLIGYHSTSQASHH
jgi:hypothetical protein